MSTTSEDFDFIACALNASVKIDTSDGIRASTMVDTFNEIVSKFAEKPALTHQSRIGEWKTVNYREYLENSQTAALAFIKLGLEPRRSVCVLSKNCPEWMFSEFAAFYANAVVCGVYPSNSPEACAYIMDKSQCNICVVDNSMQLSKIHSIRDQIPSLKAVIQIEEPFNELMDEIANYYKWSEVMSLDTKSVQQELDTRTANVKPNECALLVFTSGTTGEPKGVMLSHDNLAVAMRAVDFIFGNSPISEREKIVSYLPLCFIGGQFSDIFCPLMIGAELTFADCDAFKGTIIETFKFARPTSFNGIPRIVQKIQERLESIENDMLVVDKFLLRFLNKVALNYHLNGGDAGL